MASQTPLQRNAASSSVNATPHLARIDLSSAAGLYDLLLHLDRNVYYVIKNEELHSEGGPSLHMSLKEKLPQLPIDEFVTAFSKHNRHMKNGTLTGRSKYPLLHRSAGKCKDSYWLLIKEKSSDQIEFTPDDQLLRFQSGDDSNMPLERKKLFGGTDSTEKKVSFDETNAAAFNERTTGDDSEEPESKQRRTYVICPGVKVSFDETNAAASNEHTTGDDSEESNKRTAGDSGITGDSEETVSKKRRTLVVCPGVGSSDNEKNFRVAMYVLRDTANRIGKSLEDNKLVNDMTLQMNDGSIGTLRGLSFYIEGGKVALRSPSCTKPKVDSVSGGCCEDCRKVTKKAKDIIRDDGSEKNLLAGKYTNIKHISNSPEDANTEIKMNRREIRKLKRKLAKVNLEKETKRGVPVQDSRQNMKLVEVFEAVNPAARKLLGEDSDEICFMGGTDGIDEICKRTWW